MSILYWCGADCAVVVILGTPEMISLAYHYCISCGKPIGLYEPISAELAGALIEVASAADLDAEQLRDGVRLRHRGCDPAAAGPRAWSRIGSAGVAEHVDRRR